MDDLLIGPQSDEYFDSIYGNNYGLDGYENMWEFYLELLSELKGYDI